MVTGTRIARRKPKTMRFLPQIAHVRHKSTQAADSLRRTRKTEPLQYQIGLSACLIYVLGIDLHIYELLTRFLCKEVAKEKYDRDNKREQPKVSM